MSETVRPVLSIGMIFKNDIRSLERCLQALEPLRKALPCQLVMADTGSTDGSREVAERYADLVIDFPWVNDFAAARNAVMDRCGGVWYLTVDSDEYLDPDISGLKEFLLGRGGRQFSFASLVQRNYRGLDMAEGDYTDFLAQRMARLDSGVRYEGAIHERFADGDKGSTFLVPRAVLHHDGYAVTDPAKNRAKMERNLVLLREELRKDPDDPRRLLQCIEASIYHEDEQMGYLFRAMELLRSETGHKDQRLMHYFGPHLYRFAACVALRKELPQAEEWLAWGEEHMADTISFRVDVCAAAAVYFFGKKEYETALSWAKRYEAGCADYDAGRFDLTEQSGSPLAYSVYISRAGLRLMGCECLARLGRQREAVEWLEQMDAGRMSRVAEVTLRCMRLLPLLNREREGAQAMCGRLLTALWERADREKEEEERENRGAESAEQLRQTCLALANGIFRTEEGWWLFLQAPGDLGRGARAMEQLEPGALAEALEEIQRWEEVPSAVVKHAMEWGAPLPDGFYRQGEEQLRAVAAALGQELSMPLCLPRWAACDDFYASLVRLQFLFQLTAAAARSADWEGGAGLEALSGLLMDLAAAYLPALYRQEVLEDEGLWLALPGLHRFACCLLKARDALRDRGDELGYVRSLREALEAAPAMKGMVEYLLEHYPKTGVQLQMERLAGQIKEILDRYPPDDPAVIALKASDAYQKVAGLLEPEGPAPVRRHQPPVERQTMEEALAGSRAEIASSIREHLNRWGEQAAQGRIAYWEKWGLWGKDAQEVVDNLSAALQEHRADFLWLFDRLADETSRQVLAAVVRSWRFFELEPLERATDLVYDDYFDRSVLTCGAGEVVADLGAYTGDTFRSYVKNYGSEGYLRYYCYEITPESFNQLRAATALYPRVICRRKGVGAQPGRMALELAADGSANALTPAGEGDPSQLVEMVTLDGDIAEPLTLLKMDIEGAEQAALAGCARHIREDRPKLALSVYHNFEDIWKLPRMVEELVPGYRFYLRYHGGTGWPSEITLLALPPQA